MASSLNGRGDSNAKDANEDGNPFDASIVKVAEKVDELRGNVKAERKKEMSKQLLTKEEMETYTGVIRWLHVHIYGSRYFSLTVLWLSWLVVGTVFYSQYMTGFGLKRGFYMAVNTGYSIGWGDYPEDGLPLQWFSTFYVMAGASFVGAALGFFADAAVHDSNNWYEAQQLEHKYQRELSSHTSFVVKAVFWFSYNYQTIRPVLWWLGFTFVGTLWGCLTQDWPFPTGLYFAVSSMSTGGLQSVDASKTNDDMYFLIGVFSALGVPLMGLAMATVAKGLISTEDISDTMAEIRKDVTIEEVAMLTELGLADDSGEIDKAEFILLCVIRVGAADPMILQLIGEYFDVLDDDGSGSLSMDEITASASVIASHLRSRANLIVADTGIETDRDKDAAPAAATSLSSTIVPSRGCRKSIAIVRPTNTSSEHHDKRKKRRKAALDALFNRQVKDALQSDSESDCNDDDGDGDIENGIEEDSEDNPKRNERHTLQRRDRQSILEMLDVTIFDKKASVGSERFRGSIIGSYRKKQRDKQEQTWVASASKVAPMNSVAEKHEEAQEK